MRIIELNNHDTHNKYALNVDKIFLVELIAYDGKIDIWMQDEKSTCFHVRSKDKDKLQKIYENILDFCMSTSNPNEIGYIPLLKIDIK